MKKFLILLTAILSVVLLASCNIQEQMEQMSDQLKDQIIDIAGQFIEKNTNTGNDKPGDIPSDTPDSIPDNKPNDNSSDVTGDNVPDIPSEPNEPEIPEIPEYILLEREKYPLNKYIGITVTRQGDKITENEHKHRTVYGYGRFETTLDDPLSSHPLTYFKISNIESSIAFNFDLSNVKAEASESEMSYKEAATKIQAFASEYCVSSNFLSNVRRIEIGTTPDLTISATDYALLLNTIYDDNCKQNSENVGTTFINPEIRLITGKMSTINLPYIKFLMNAIKSGRNDSFLPITGWSFSIKSNGIAPEKLFNKNEALNQLVAYRNENYDSIEIYLSDFGWDTVNTENSSYVAPADGYTSEEIQAMYILRAYLLLYGMDIDKASYSTVIDTDSNGEGIIKSDGTKKLAYSILEFFKSKMTDMYLKEIVSNGENNIYSYKFEDKNGKTVYAIWSTADATYDLTAITGNVTVSTYSKDENGYIDINEQIDSTLTLNTNGFAVFVEHQN